jgi:hypothetical protein
MTSKTLLFDFKGQRNYVHGTDMLNQTFAAVCEVLHVSSISDMRFTIMRMTSHNLVAETGSDEVAHDPNQLVATLGFSALGRRWMTAIKEDSSTPETRRAYNEEFVTEVCRFEFDSAAIIQFEKSPFTVIETIVAMTKALHTRHFADAPGRWVFCRFDSVAWPLEPDARGLKVMFRNAIGTRLTRCEVSYPDIVFGDVYFSAKVDT